MPESTVRPATIDFEALGLPRAAAGHPEHRDGPRRRRGDVGRADRAPVPAGVRVGGRRRARRLGRASTVGGARLAFSTDSFVVKPMFFPGGIDRRPRGQRHRQRPGDVRRADRWSCRPRSSSRRARRWPTSAGSPQAVGTAALAAGVKLVTGDTKVVDSGRGDGVFINTAGIGLVADGVDIRPQRAAVGDVVIVSGDIGVHGVAVMSCREGLEFGTTVASDTAPLHGLVAAMLATGADMHVAARPDPRRGGGHAQRDRQGREGRRRAGRAGPADPGRRSATPAACSASTRCTWPTRASCSRSSRRRTPTGAGGDAGAPSALAPRSSARASPSTRGWWSARTALGGTRVVDLPIGEQLPRIC